MTDISWWGWAVLGLSAFFIGLSKTGLPGVGILAIISVAAVIPARASTGLILPMLIVGDIFAVSYYHRHAVWKHLLQLLPYAVVGVIVGYLTMGHVNDQQLRRIIGGIVLALLGLNYWRNRYLPSDATVPTAWWFPALLGLLAGVTTMMANAAGPIMIVYLLAMRLPKEEFVGTGAWYFFMVNCFKVPFSAHLGFITLTSLKFNLWLAPFIIIGAFVGIAVVKRIPEKHFTLIVQWLAVAGAIKLLI
jgi:uncharacterized membrane protein YfcA